MPLARQPQQRPELDPPEYIVWPCKDLARGAMDDLDHAIRSVVGPDIKVVKEMLMQGTVLLAWLVVAPDATHLDELAKLHGQCGLRTAWDMARSPFASSMSKTPSRIAKRRKADAARMPFAAPPPPPTPLEYDQYMVYPCSHLKWPKDEATRDAVDALDRQIRDIVGPDVGVIKEMVLNGAMLLFWLVKEPSDEHLQHLAKLDGVAEVQKDGIEDDISYD